eukprot:3817473-Rhodomonas_salina.1
MPRGMLRIVARDSACHVEQHAVACTLNSTAWYHRAPWNVQTRTLQGHVGGRGAAHRIHTTTPAHTSARKTLPHSCR